VTDGSPTVSRVTAAAFEVPTDQPESDGTLAWDSTTIVVVEVAAGATTGLGYTYGSAALLRLVGETLAPVVVGRGLLDIPSTWEAMSARLRNEGRPGAGMMALSAVDIALWDAKARLFEAPLADLLGRARNELPVYGSGGFTSYSLERLGAQLEGWVAAGIPRVKIKVAREPGFDAARLDVARKAIGDDIELYVDANGAFGRTQASRWAERYRNEWGVSWFEEPVSSDDLTGLRWVREHAPAGLDVAAGEYGFLIGDFRALLEAGSVDCLQVDVTRCGGVTAAQRVFGLAHAHHVDVSAHCAPGASAHAFAPVLDLRHLEYFHDHARVEHLLFDGACEPEGGSLRADGTRPGLGLELKREDADAYCVGAVST
jgi:L-alanine-DL-glutamate epimerase-like enolase superfamily enzyme